MKLSLGGYSQVTMTDRWFQELRAGRAFSRLCTETGAVGNYSMVQLANPAGSGKQIIVAQIIALMPVASAVYIQLHNAELGTDTGALVNLLVGGSAGASHARHENGGAILGTTVHYQYVAASTTTVLWPSWGPELSPGQTVIIAHSMTNQPLTCDFLVNEV